MFKNKHVVAALIITPILAVLGYFLVDSIVAEKPHVAKKGGSYALIEKPNCRYTSGACGLKNNDFELLLTTDWLDDNRLKLHLKSVVPLEGAKVALVDSESDEGLPSDMTQTDMDGMAWNIDLDRPDRAKSRLRVAVSADGVLYYGDAAMTFTLYETSFKEDFRR
ncbi:MAG: hypothetical protein AseanaTS_08770 [Candidatus Pelagadaptatus aseana]|uniref:hypothetical protein n=1 Tax=Candidatus Pelagadaptatus aseana TaxID=3120508 RepID=UPI0039B2FB73